MPISRGGLAAGMCEDVEQSAALQGFVQGRPVGDIVDAMLFEKAHGVVAEAAQQIVELALVRVIHTKFVNHRGGSLAGGGLVLDIAPRRGEPVGRREKRGRG